MDVLNTMNSFISNNNNLILSELDKMIKIKHLKEKNKNKTCVYGVLDFIPEKDIDPLIKIIKKRLGCSGSLTEEIIVSTKGKKASSDVLKVLVFSGNHVEEIRDILLEKKITDEEHIKI